MRTGRPKAALTLTQTERRELESLASRARSATAFAQRVRMVLGCARGDDNKWVTRQTWSSADSRHSRRNSSAVVRTAVCAS